MITAKGLCFSYDGISQLRYPDFSCNEGEEILITGQSGCGKTTLLHMLCGLLRPSAGEILINGTDITQLNAKRLDSFRGSRIGIVFQKSHFIKSLSVEDNIILAAAKENRKDVSRLMQVLQIGHLAKKKPSGLSQGEQQRVAIARAIINKPAVLLADEPTSSLDDFNTDKVIQLLREQTFRWHCALVIVTHDFRLKELVSESISLT